MVCQIQFPQRVPAVIARPTFGKRFSESRCALDLGAAGALRLVKMAPRDEPAKD